jgi:hypothetical protein
MFYHSSRFFKKLGRQFEVHTHNFSTPMLDSPIIKLFMRAVFVKSGESIFDRLYTYTYTYTQACTHIHTCGYMHKYTKANTLQIVMSSWKLALSSVFKLSYYP